METATTSDDEETASTGVTVGAEPTAQADTKGTMEGGVAAKAETTSVETVSSVDANGVTGPEGGRAAHEANGARESATAVHRGMDGLVPEMRERLERVLHRMKTEYGHDARVSETYRSQSRQDALHAQGRSAPGQVVTWTRRSNHTLGRAADIVVNGGYDDAEAYATLQRVAREEGLHTLGSRDPGHLELPKGVGSTLPTGRRVDLANVASLAELGRLAPDAGVTVTDVGVTPNGHAREAAPAPVAAPAGAAGMARVARVATVAQVAHVAQVARVATPGAAAVRRGVSTQRTASTDETRATANTMEAKATGTTATANAATTATPLAMAAARAEGGSAGRRDGGTRGEERSAARDERSAETGVVGAESSANERFGGTAHGTEAPRGATSSRAEAVQAAVGADALTRLDAIDALRDGAAARPLSHLTLSVDNAAGGADRIRVEARGRSVGVTVDLSDAAAADRLGARMGELQQALEQRGLEADTLRVRSGVAATPEAIDVSRVAASTLERESARSGTHTGAQQGQQQQQQDRQQQQDHHAPRDRDGRPAADDPRRDPNSRQRFRQEPKETDQ
jgi:hypothetical protein